jgi:PST family polysaccharide transporter
MITLPYVTRVLGVEAWGTLALVQVVIGYFTMVTNWGFGMSGTRKVAAHRNDPDRLSEIFFAAWAGQWLLGVASILILGLFVVFVPFFNQHSVFYIIGIGVIISSVLFPVWFLNGIERMREVAIIQITTRAATVPLIFLLIQGPEDAPLLLAIGAMTGILGGTITIIWMRRNLGLTWRRPSQSRAMDELREGAAIFGSTVWISLYTTLTPLMLGLFASPAAIGYYALADRVRLLAQSALSPISSAIFPRMSHLFNTDSVQARALLKRSSKLILLISASASMSLWVLAEHIVILLAGEQFRPSITVLQWLAPLPFVISLSNIFGIQVMIPNQKTKAFNRILGAAGAMSLIIIVPLIQLKGAEGASINTFITECFVTLAMAIYLWKTGFFGKSDYWGKT